MLTYKNQIPHKAVKNLRCGEKPKAWDPSTLFPDKDDLQICEEMADFFNNISQEFAPLSESDFPQTHNRQLVPLMPHEVSARLKAAKKSNAMVPGDVFPKMISDLADFIAIPLTKI